MENVTNLHVLQWRVFAPDVVPYHLIITPWGTDFLKHVFGFREADWNREGADYVFQDGTYKPEGEGEPTVIPSLAFNDRRIAVQVRGGSDAAAAVYVAVAQALAQLSPAFPEVHPLLMSEDTSCVARLDFDWTALLNPALLEHVAEWVTVAARDEVESAIKGISVRFTVGAMPSKKLVEYGVSVYDRTIAVEPRADVPLSEQTYFTYSPCDSDTHLKLIAQLETSLSKKPGRIAKR